MTSDSAFNDKTKIEWISTDQLSVIWAEAQRPLDERFAKEIADNFDPEQFGTIAVTLPNGKGMYHIIDGQHRKRAVEILFAKNPHPVQKVPCQVFEAEDPARAAELFDQINSHRKAQQPIDFFKVRVTAGNPDYVAIDKIVRTNGYRVANTSHAASTKNIACVQALVSVYRQHGGETLDATLKVIQATWGVADRNAVTAPIIRGYGLFMAEYRTRANWGRVKEKIAKKYSPGSFIGAAKSAREILGGGISSAIKDILVQSYNRGLPASRQLKSKRGGDEPVKFLPADEKEDA